MSEIISEQELADFVEQYRPPFPPGSFAYSDAVVAITARELRRSTDEQAADPEADMAEEIKVNPLGVESSVTKHDKRTECIMGALLAAANHRVEGEEGTADWPEGLIPIATHHTDPIDGTGLFVDYMRELKAWMQLPESNRPSRPVCGSMLSDGVVFQGGSIPAWGSIAAPFLHPDGIVRWSASPEVWPMRTEPDGSQHLLIPANISPAPYTGGAVIVASDSTEKTLKEPLQAAGLTVVKFKSVVAAGLCVMDAGLSKRIGLADELGRAPIVAAVARTAEDWDSAGVVAIANYLGYFATDVRGAPRTIGTDSKGLVLAANRRIGGTILRAIASF